MRVERAGDQWIIARDWTPPRYFIFFADNDRACWSKFPDRAMKCDTEEDADRNLILLRSREKVVRESHPGYLGGQPRNRPTPLSEYRWTTENKKLLVRMFTIGCSHEAMAVQFGRTAPACRAMYHLMLRRGEI